MKWIKQGHIFNPVEHTLPNDCKDYAQAPQALVFDDFVRVYFSTRSKDTNGKFLSHIAYIELEDDLKTIKTVSSDTVIPLGGLGCFDEHGIFPLNPVRVKDKVFGYISGINRKVSVPIDTAIGLAISNDNGLTFTRIGPGPILASSLHEPCIVGDPFVMHRDNTFHMFYLFSDRWLDNAEMNGDPARVYKIAHATSKDGINWQRNSKPILKDKLDIDECQALPTVAHFNNQYHMFFCYRKATDFKNNRNNSYRIGYAYSEDLETWHRRDDQCGIDVSDIGWDSEMICYPHIFRFKDAWYLLYNGNSFGKLGFGIAKLQQ